MTPTTTLRPQLRDKVLDAADRLLGRLGYRKTTMDDLAREAGIGRRTIYLYFASKEEVFFASIDRVVERMLEELRRISVAHEPAPTRLARMLTARVLLRFDSVRDYYQSLDEMLGALRAGYLERRERWFADEARVIAEVIAAGVASGELAADDPEAAARTLVLATNSLLPWSLSARQLGSRRDVERDALAIAELLLRGLAAKPPATGRAARGRSRAG